MKTLLCLMAVFAGYCPAKAAVVFAANPSELNANDSVDWGQFATNSVFPSPAAFTSVNGLAGTASTDDPGGFFRAVVPGSWASGFLPGDKILNTNSFTYHPIVVAFDAPVFGAGAFVDDDLTITGFTASISAYNGDTVLGVFTASGSNTGFGSVPFLGVLDDRPEITKVVFEITNTGSFTPLDMAIGAVVLNDATVAAIPEPATFLLAGAALFLAAALRHYSRR
jgi:PEP-CTERM motif-containing protein